MARGILVSVVCRSSTHTQKPGTGWSLLISKAGNVKTHFPLNELDCFRMTAKELEAFGRNSRPFSPGAHVMVPKLGFNSEIGYRGTHLHLAWSADTLRWGMYSMERGRSTCARRMAFIRS